MMNLVFFLEERSAKVLLEGLLPRILPVERVCLRYIPFEGKQDLEKQLVRKLRGWRRPNTHFIVLRDQDQASCHSVKARLQELCSRGGRPDTLVRVACREIESWYLGDLQAVEDALTLRGLSAQQSSKKFRDPDHLSNPSTELQRLTHGAYRKVSGSRAMGKCLRASSKNKSQSFRVFVSGVRSILPPELAD